MLFFSVVLLEMEYQDGKCKTFDVPINIRFRLDDLVNYQELSPDTCRLVLRVDQHTHKFATIRTTLKELDAIISGANQQTAGLLYGKDT